jgi:hypothetical protein
VSCFPRKLLSLGVAINALPQQVSSGRRWQRDPVRCQLGASGLRQGSVFSGTTPETRRLPAAGEWTAAASSSADGSRNNCLPVQTALWGPAPLRCACLLSSLFMATTNRPTVSWMTSAITPRNDITGEASNSNVISAEFPCVRFSRQRHL